MKNLLFALLFVPVLLDGQQTCQGSFTEYVLNANHIRASFFPRGNKFNSGMDGGFQVPYPSEQRLSTIFASSPWIAGFDDAGNLRGGTETFPNGTGMDFAVGPLESIGTLFPDSICSHFNKAWIVFAEDILKHRADFESDSIINDTMASIFGWPGRGNTFFEKYNGIKLPNELTWHWAPFDDNNWNGLYEPDKGECPVVEPNSTWPVVPDQMMWMVFNDALISDSIPGLIPSRFEIQLTAYSFFCQDNEILNNTIFNRYKIINRSVIPLDSIFFGMWTDYDLGCSTDDFIGSDSLRSTEYVYNSDVIDGVDGKDCPISGDAYRFNVPPIQSMTWLSHPMHSFISYPSTETFVPIERFRLLNGQWTDGTDMRPSGDGYKEDPGLSVTRFMFNGDPRDTNSWSAVNVLNEGLDVRSISSVSLGRLNPGSITVVDLAYGFHLDTSQGYLGQITTMFENIDSLKKINLFWGRPCLRHEFCLDNNCVWPGDFNHNGRVDHEDYLAWGVFNTQSGPNRNGLINWRGHYAEEWNHKWEDINAKHADGNGDGVVDIRDIEIHHLNHLFENDDFKNVSQYPLGDDLVLSADQGYIDKISNIQVTSGKSFDNVLGISFEIEFDTALFELVDMHALYPDVPDVLSYETPGNQNAFYPYAFVQTNQESVSLENGFTFCSSNLNGLQLRPGKSAPDSTMIRLRNLKGVDREGNELHLGSLPLTICREGFVCTPQTHFPKAVMHPNPARDEFYIITTEETECILYDVNGRILLREIVSGPRDPIRVGHLPQGLYIVRVVSTGETLKLILQ
jgi:hypothetical protein